MVRVAVLLAGVLLPQLVLIGPSLAGRTLLLPLDMLADRTFYLPRPSVTEPTPIPKEGTLGDLIFQSEVHRRLVVDEVRAGRVPLWNPYNYCGHPLLAANHTQVFSPYRLLDYAWPSPVAVAWSTLLRSVVMAVGAYLFFRRAMNAGWLAAAAAAWFVPLTGTMILSAGYAGSAVVSFLPWVLLAADRCAVRPSGRAAAGMAVAVAFALLAGHAAFAGHVLLAGGTYFLWRHVSLHGVRGAARRPALPGLTAAGGGMLLGVLLTAPQTLPTIDYLRSSLRVAQRGAGGVETKPGGPAALLQVVLPYVNGSTQHGSLYVGPERNRIESAAGGYAGLLVALVLMPLGWADPQRRKAMRFWTALALSAAVPAVGVPVLDLPFRVPPLSLLRNNRLVFVTAFAVVAMAAVGLDVLSRRPHLLRERAGRACLTGGLVAALALGYWCSWRAAQTPVGPDDASQAAARNLAVLLWPDRWPTAVNPAAGARTAPATYEDLVSWFGLMFRNGAVLSGVAAALALGLYILSRRPPAGPRFAAVIPAVAAVLAAAEMTAAAAGVNVQADPALYFPRLGWMDAVARVPGRVCGVNTLPANLLLMHRLPDIRGYDAADPMPIVDLIQLAQDPHSKPILSLPYAVTQFLGVNGREPGPVANLLNVRHLVGRGPPPDGVKLLWVGHDYWVRENPGALPRVTLPRRTEVVPDKADRLRRLAAADHDPAAVTLLESAASDPGAAEGTARITVDEPGRVVIETDLTTGGIVRLADAWDGGWRATYNGQAVPVVRVDHALRGASVPAGHGTIEFRYEPASLRWGLILAAAAGGVLVVTLLAWRPRSSPAAEVPAAVADLTPSTRPSST